MNPARRSRLRPTACVRRSVNIARLLAGLFLLLPVSAAPAPAPGEFVAEGKNRAAVASERPRFEARLDVAPLLGALAKESGSLKTPQEPRHWFPLLPAVPVASDKPYAPWLQYFQPSVVFVLGRLGDKSLNIARWSLSLHDSQGEAIRTFTGLGVPPAAFYWDGRDHSGQPVAVGQGYVPELTLEDYYGAKVQLPQKRLYLGQFLWEERHRLLAATTQDAIFSKKRAHFSPEGSMIVRELSYWLRERGAAVLTLELKGQDPDLQAQRARVLKAYFSRENLNLKQVESRAEAGPEPDILTAEGILPGSWLREIQP